MEENKEKKEKTGFMAQARSVIIAIIAALSAIICVSIFTGGLVDYKKSGGGSGITAVSYTHLFARFIYGGRVSLSVGIISAVISMAVGVPLGLLAGYYLSLIHI